MSWNELVKKVDKAKTQDSFVVYGVARSLCDKELWVDFGDELGEISMMKITFRDAESANAAYCKAMRFEVKVVEMPS